MNDRDLLKSLANDLLHLGKKYGEVIVDELVSKDHKTIGGMLKEGVGILHKNGVAKLNELPQLQGSTRQAETSTKALPAVEVGETVVIKNEKVETKEQVREKEQEVSF